jgi:hypothetical protein
MIRKILDKLKDLKDWHEKMDDIEHVGGYDRYRKGRKPK